MKLIIKDSVYDTQANVIELEVGNTLNLLKLILLGFGDGKQKFNEYKALLGFNDKGDMVITHYDDFIE